MTNLLLIDTGEPRFSWQIESSSRGTTQSAYQIIDASIAAALASNKSDLCDTGDEYPDIVRAVAAEHKAPLIDMHRKSELVLKQYGVEESKKLFLQLKPGENANYPNGIQDNTHFSPLGAQIMARLAVAAIRELNLGLAKNLKLPSHAESR